MKRGTQARKRQQPCDRSLGTFLGTYARSQTQPHGVRRKRSRCFLQETWPDRTTRNHTQKSGENSKTGGCRFKSCRACHDKWPRDSAAFVVQAPTKGTMESPDRAEPRTTVDIHRIRFHSSFPHKWCQSWADGPWAGIGHVSWGHASAWGDSSRLHAGHRTSSMGPNRRDCSSAMLGGGD